MTAPRLALALMAATFASPATGGEDLPEVRVRCGEASVIAEVAFRPEQRQKGLSGRTRLGKQEGMLFVWLDSGVRGMWMKDTLIPLSVAFMNAKGKILNIERMKPLRRHPVHRSKGPARFALEVNRGWFARNGIRAGDRCRFRLPGLGGRPALRVGP